MSLFTSSYLKQVYNQNILSLNESVRTRNFSASISSTFDIFLSHSFLDKDIVGGLYTELTKKGYKVYVDWIVDPQLSRGNVTKETAELIRSRLKNSKSLLLAVSSNANLSKWIPWELGYVDGNTGNCALVPIELNNKSISTFERSEYLLLYPFIKRDGDSSTLYTAESNHTYVPFDNWLKNKSKPQYQGNPIY